jgi:uncharacterized membrane protein
MINKIIIVFKRLHLKHKIRYVIIGVVLLAILMLFLEKALKNVGIILSSVITSYLYNLFASTYKELQTETNRIIQEEMIR